MEDKNYRLRLAELKALNDRRLLARQKLKRYEDHLARAFNKKVQPLSFQVGDQVLALKRPIIMAHKTECKFAPNWEGPYVACEVYSNGAYKIVDGQGVRVVPINGMFLKHYYP